MEMWGRPCSLHASTFLHSQASSPRSCLSMSGHRERRGWIELSDSLGLKPILPPGSRPWHLLDTGSGSSLSIFPHSTHCFDLFSSLPCAAAAKSRVLVSCGGSRAGREGWVLKVLRQHLQRPQPVGGLAEPGAGRETGRGGSWRGLGGAVPASPN